MIATLAEYALTHEAGHAVVGRFVKVCAPGNISFVLTRGSDGVLYLGDFATASPFPPDEQIPQLPDAVKRCFCYTLAAGVAATQFRGLPVPNEKDGIDSDRERLSKFSSKTLEDFVSSASAVIKEKDAAFYEVISQCKRKYEQFKVAALGEGKHILLDANELQAIFDRTF